MLKLLCVFVFAAAAVARNFNSVETRVADSVYNRTSERESKHFSVTQESNMPRYFICNCENIDISYESGLKILQNYADYENQFRYILRSQNTAGDNWFFILGIPLVKTWLWGDVSEDISAKYAKISFVQTRSEVNYSDSVKSFVVIDFEKLVLQWNLIKINETTSRFCLTGMVQPQKPVPQWLVRTALKKVVPRTLKNIKKQK